MVRPSTLFRAGLCAVATDLDRGQAELLLPLHNTCGHVSPRTDMQAIATAQASAESCTAEVLGLGEAGDINDPNSFFCSVQAIGEDGSFAKDAFIDASAEAAVAAGCYENDTASQTEVAEDLAVAFASAFAEAVVACDVVGSGGLCGLAAADINTTIWAAAEVFALGFADATGTCAVELCQVDALIVTEAIAEVVSSAAASALAAGCTGATPNRHFPWSLHATAALPPTSCLHSALHFSIELQVQRCR